MSEIFSSLFYINLTFSNMPSFKTLNKTKFMYSWNLHSNKEGQTMDIRQNKGVKYRAHSMVIGSMEKEETEYVQ